MALGRRLLSLRQSVTRAVVQRAASSARLGAAGAPRDRRDRGRGRSAWCSASSRSTTGWAAAGRSSCFVGRDRRGDRHTVAVADVRPLTERGREIRDHLEGLRLYIRLAEADRLRVLQSPSGAMRVDRPAAASVRRAARRTPGAPARPAPTRPSCSSSTSGSCRTPCCSASSASGAASSRRSTSSAARQPGWYAGRGGFNAARVLGGVSSFSSASSTSWSGSSSSSSSSGSGGGGSSGGGGGGGGGGGV